MPDLSAILSLPYLLPAQAQKHVTHNEALRMLDLAVQLSVTSRSASVPPASPAPGERYIVGSGGTGDWAGQDGAVAIHDGGWQFTAPLPGWRAWVADEARLAVFDGSAWGLAQDLQNLDGVGINTTSDAVNRLAVTAPATLFSHEGAGHQVKLNKAGMSDTASLLFQTNWSGRAEMGTSGSDAFEIKVSADGSIWQQALGIDPATGVVDLPQGAKVAGNDMYHAGNAVGAGGLLQEGSGASGAWLRLADGTQICTFVAPGLSAATSFGALYRSAAASWSFPVAFSAAPVVSGHVAGGESWIMASSVTAAGADYARVSPISDSGPEAVSLMAVGRWL